LHFDILEATRDLTCQGFKVQIPRRNDCSFVFLRIPHGAARSTLQVPGYARPAACARAAGVEEPS
jgi:hypothetical protein